MAFRSREIELWTDTLRSGQWKLATAAAFLPDLSGTFSPKLSSHPLAGRGPHTYPNTNTFSSPTADANVQIARARRSYQLKLTRLAHSLERDDRARSGVVAPAQLWRGLQETGINLPEAFVEGIIRRSMFGDNGAAPKLGLRPEVNWWAVVQALRNVQFDGERGLGEAALLQVAHECARSINVHERGTVQPSELHQLFKTLDKNKVARGGVSRVELGRAMKMLGTRRGLPGGLAAHARSTTFSHVRMH